MPRKPKIDLEKMTNNIEKIRFWVIVAFSAIIVGVALYIVLSKNYTDEYVKWAFGMIGIIIGYWLAPGNKT